MGFLLSSFQRKRVTPLQGLVPFSARLFDERGQRFAKLRDARVLIYWPHGFGDFVHLGHILPLLEPSNRYWIARYGDDFSALYKENPYVPMMPSGIQQTANSFGSSARDYHLGIRYGQANGSMETLSVSNELAEHMQRAEIDTVLWTDYPDPNGKNAFPFHSKIRSLAKCLVLPERIAQFNLSERLVHAALFASDNEANAFVAQRLRTVFGDRDLSEICLVLSGGHTAPKKNWDDAHVYDFTNHYLNAAKETRAVVLLNNAPIAKNSSLQSHGAITNWSELFPDSQGPGESIEYARLICALLNQSALFVGVPAGPMHLALAMGNIPTVGLWRVHHPAAYDEPNPLARHLVAKSVRQVASAQSRLERTFPLGFADPVIALDTDDIPAAQVYEIAEELMTQRCP